MKRNQSGFTLIEIAIVLVIIGLLLGGVLKGQELINSAKVKNLAGDFKNVPVFIYGYQDKFKSLPGDDPNHATHLLVASGCTPGAAPCGDGVINGSWDSTTITEESVYFWQHVRLAGLTGGATTIPATLTQTDPYFPQNAVGGRIGIQSNLGTGATAPKAIATLNGTYVICSANIPGKLAKQLDILLDDGVSSSGSLQFTTTAAGGFGATAGVPAATGAIPDDTLYTVCVGV